MTRTRWILIGCVAALLVALGVGAAGGRGILYQAIFHNTATGGADRTAYAKLADIVSVKDFGAVGDGVTDDTAAVTSAVTVAGWLTELRFPCPGSYKTTTYGTIPCGQPFAAVWDTLTFPIVIGHRGNAQGAPENTMEAFKQGAAIGVPLETDVQMSVDQQLFIMHDATVDRTTDGSGSAPAFNLDSLRMLNAAAKFLPPANSASSSGSPTIGTAFFNREPVPTFDEYLREFGGKVLLLPEDKDCTDATGTAMAQKIVGRGLQRSVVVTSFCINNLVAVHAVDSTIKTLLYATSGSPPNLGTATADGVWAIGCDSTYCTASSVVTTLHASGFKVFIWTVDDVSTAETYLGWGVDGVITNDPAYIKQYAGTTPKYLSQTSGTILAPIGTITSGWRTVHNRAANATTVLSSAYVTFTGPDTVAPVAGYNFIIEPGMRTASAANSTGATYTVTANVKITTASADTTRWIELRFGCDTDQGGSSQPTCVNGYGCLYRQNGNLEVYKLVNLVATQIGTNGAFNTYTTGDAFQLQATVTATGITCTRVDTAQSKVVSDATYDRSGFASLSGSGVVPGLSQMKLQ